jgi:alpha-amylase
MCNNPGSFDMSTLDHAGLVGIDPAGAVTFVENHDTDRGGVGGPVVQNKLLAYAYILTSEGYPCVFYRDYSTDNNCFGLKPEIDQLILIHETLAEGATQQRWKDPDLFAYERTGGSHLLVGLNKGASTRTITVQTGFPPNTQLHDFTNRLGPIRTNATSQVTLTVPANVGGRGYVCYAPSKNVIRAARSPLATTQIYEGAQDLDIKPASEAAPVQVCRVYAAAGTSIEVHLSPDAAHWTEATTIEVDIKDPSGRTLGSQVFGRAGGSVTMKAVVSDFHTVFVKAANTPPQNKTPAYTITLVYTAPESITTQ